MAEKIVNLTFEMAQTILGVVDNNPDVQKLDPLLAIGDTNEDFRQAIYTMADKMGVTFVKKGWESRRVTLVSAIEASKSSVATPAQIACNRFKEAYSSFDSGWVRMVPSKEFSQKDAAWLETAYKEIAAAWFAVELLVKEASKK